MSLQQLSRLLPLPDEELKQVLDYAGTLSKQDAVEHFQNLLGDSPEASAFVASFNSRRKGPSGPSSTANSAAQSRSQSQSRPQKQSRASAPSEIEPVPKQSRNRDRKKKADIHVPQARKVNSTGPAPGTAYKKDDETFEYISKSSKKLNVPSASGSAAGSRSSSVGPSARAESSKAPAIDIRSFMLDTAGSATPPPPAPKKQKQPAPAGHLIGDNLQKKKAKPAAASTTTKVNITGGLPMTGASAAVTDLDAAIRALEISTNPTHKSHSKSRKCNCVATRHPLQSAAPNCMKCGKVICIKEGLGPCTFCGTPLLKPDELQAILRELSAERGRERMAVDREAHKRPDMATAAPVSYAQARGGPMSDALLLARQHKDRLLAFQAQNAQRTRVVDEAADFDVGLAQGHLGGSMWSTPLERALELKRQQKILREMEWNAKPEYEKRRQVVSIDVVGRKVVKKMAAIERPATPESEEDGEVEDEYGVLEAIGGPGSGSGSGSGGSGGKFSKNPLLGGLIRPVFMPGKGKGADKERERKANKWRRVQDDRDDNEAVILDGGVYGHTETDEPAVCG
ncbi:hypothetical protein TD95_002621 [Thielaviopsis punctulata]|uniref:TRIP4/RQT4 C2HC5-type zinc finger domain-containing protein n=1 Tax=Thielaviopsis punctulata TaxID=72032 RepID=A0A0F4ZL04_9PEZI|nr:hypothetical protein TD95_002621 [Thielaviopsis punctulata]